MNFSSIRKLLLSTGKASLHRHVFILAGDEAWQKNALQEILLDFEKSSLWVGGQPNERVPSVAVEKAKTWLGNEKQVVVFDANKSFDSDSFAAITGIVVGGGIFFLLLPCKDKWNQIYPTFFGQRLIKSTHDKAELIIIDQNKPSFDFIAKKITPIILKDNITPFLTLDQKKSVETIEEHALKNINKPIVLISDRGRGKSAALGLAAARLMLAGVKNIAITAPRLRATDVIFKHIAELIPYAEVSRGKIKYKNKQVDFYSPDQLMENKIEADLLLIDEAAAIPVSLLTSFLHRYPQCVFATTVHGYEGTGRGFALRFFKELDKYNSKWLKLQMNAPIRWAENDPLENWMFDLLCLDAEMQEQHNIDDLELDKLSFSKVKRKELSENSVLLKEVFALLILAHYRTQPSDLVRLLDDENLLLYIAKYDENLLSVTLVSHEGLFEKELSEKVYRGERRPAGHLLAQTLTYHCGIEYAATFNYARIMRIAVLPEYQRSGIGSKFLDYVVNAEKMSGRDAIGISFGMTSELMRFWLGLKFNVVRIGFTREQTSGEHAIVMLMGLSEQGRSINNEASNRFLEQLPFWSEDVLADIASELNHHFKLKNNKEVDLNVYEKKDLLSFVETSRNYELCISAINKFVLANNNKISGNTFPDELEEIIYKKVKDKKSWKVISDEMKLNGKESSRVLFKRAIIHLMGN